MDAKRKLCQIKDNWHWLVGPMALIWLLVRSGANPKRLTYPCQRAAMPVAGSWILAAAAFLAGSLLLRRFAKVSAVAMVLAGVVWMITGAPDVSQSEERRWTPSAVEVPPVWEVPDPIAKVVVLDNIAPSLTSLAAGSASVPDASLRDAAMDELRNVMTTEGIHLYRTAEHPDGIVGADNVVVIKGNYQWTAQNTTSNDRVKGLITQILEHPDGFSGEIIVADNTQDHGTGINDADNNSDDIRQSIGDVVNTFYAKGYPVFLLDWFSIFYAVPQEYDQGDMSDGYLYDPSTHVTYPKFQSPSGDYYISAGKGIWDTESQTYDLEKLCIINFPVLKAHFRGGATIAVKNWVGMGTIAYYYQRYGGIDPLHDVLYFGPYALVARIMEETWPRLNIVDANWTSCTGPLTLDTIVRTNMLLASTDPVAVSWYSAKHILTPIAQYPSSETNPDDSRSLYNYSLTNWANYLADSAGLPCTMDSSRMIATDGGVNFHADTVIGWAPFDVTFEGSSSLSVDSWTWAFSDSEAASGQTVSRTFNEGGIYDVGLTIDAQSDARTRNRQHYITVLADTIVGEQVEIEKAGSVEVTLYATNNAPADDIMIPVEYSGDLELYYDSFTVAGCRTESFTYTQMIHLSPATKRFTLRMRVGEGPYPGLMPGTGPILRLFFHTVGIPDVGDSAVIQVDGYQYSSFDRRPTFSGVLAEYEPISSNGVVKTVSCCKDIRGNIDGDPADIVDISDLVFLVDFMFSGGAEPTCWKEANIDGDLIGDVFKQVDIADLVYLVDYMFNGAAAPPACLVE